MKDIASVCGGLSELTGGSPEGISRALDLVRREELVAVKELAANARAGQEATEARLAAAIARIEALEAQVQGLAPPRPIGGGPGMIA